jgi:predicted alpha/beta-hydrolase family hydrolase
VSDQPTNELVEPDDRHPTDRRPRWWPIGVGAAIALVVVWAFATAWVGIWGSSPAYLITLVLSLAVAIGLATWALLVGPPPQRPPWKVWSARAGLLIVGAVLLGLLVYLKPLSAKQIALDALDDGNGVTVDVSRSSIRLTPTDGPRPTGLAFYPGAKVDPQAYAHVLRPIAEAGFPVVIFKQPYNLAVLAPNAANAVIGDPDDAIDRWAVGGHSLGGAMASSYAESDRDELVGLLLFAAYPVSDMSERTGLAVMSVSGTNDGLATPADIDERRPDLPAATEYVAIDGGIHSFFGDYGEQRGDGTPGTSRADAQGQIAAASISFLEGLDDRDDG